MAVVISWFSLTFEHDDCGYEGGQEDEAHGEHERGEAVRVTAASASAPVTPASTPDHREVCRRGE